MCDSSVSPPGTEGLCIFQLLLFVTESKFKSEDIKVYHVDDITETMGEVKTVAIVDLVNICTDTSSVKRAPTNEIV